MSIFVTSDLHFGHDREFVWKVRGYSCVEEMNEIQVQKWNKTVDENDDVYILGDLMLGEKINVEYIRRLKGKLHIVYGNHDTATRRAMYAELSNVVECNWAIMLDYRKYHFYMTHFPTMTGNLEKESLKQMTLNLFGHTHQNGNFYEDRPYMYHVGVDSHDGYPVLLDDIIEQMYMKVQECKGFLGEVPEDDVSSTKDSNLYEVICRTVNNWPDWKKTIYKQAIAATESPTVEPRCGKCARVFPLCGNTDIHGDCPEYKRDPPDGGYYG